MINFFERERHNFSTDNVSTELTLLESKESANNSASTSSTSNNHLSLEERRDVSIELNLYEDPFKIKKRLTKSDVSGMCRLLLKINLVKQHILPYLTVTSINEIESKNGARVMIWDHDTMSLHSMSFKKWSSSKSYVFIDSWSKDFVNRRGLMEGDEIGLHWDSYTSRFNFRVLERAPRN
ncbi:hypothetical protein CFOL_v3_19880 [Cephalotus follicularis]|uniref:B3 domain-containing protein n=1 Tax=Cephalotus follicularis TaxID=3775 RepID=A0A1Q3C7Y3_CEPFO|nr:hypothetical protein CFOL_v3_19880 [Cephalotus follicularis]